MKKFIIWTCCIIGTILLISVFSYWYDNTHPKIQRNSYEVDWDEFSGKRKVDSIRKASLEQEAFKKAQVEARKRDSLEKLRRAYEIVESNPYDEGYEEGYEEGYNEGYEEAIEKGRK